MFIALLAIILTLILVVGLHEAGHALAAKLFDIKIQRISIGFGKPILSWQDKKGQEWVWAIWPIGGYVKLLNSRIQEVKPSDYPYCFDKKPAWQRIIILLAGGFANFVVALLALTIFYMVGYQQLNPVIKEIDPQGIAAAAGIKASDRFVSIEGWPTNSWQEVGNVLIVNLGKSDVIATVADANNQERQLKLNLAMPFNKNTKGLAGYLGITIDKTPQYKKQVAPKPLLTALSEAFNTVIRMIVFLILALKQVLIGAIPFSSLLGPIGLISVSVGSFNQGIVIFLYFIANFSLAVGLVNLFPVPGLDGGSILLTMIEKIRGKPISIALEVLLYRLAFIAFIIFLIQLVLNDLQRMVH
ncbi:membrane associated zinc metalloprotease [Legionella busanensis]|uniref:Membrane associated zinc metalloprotease n=1 Tax=Legionella busanensis TaxID=190655 RepID=A0A378JMP1_9GAMM|nr:site-2 protease family protein [Legionella busanensis]STX52001.1 membrane associated zinc metalloprotease [Legionella busanensis]